jgi:hypothetical protein
VPQVASFLPVSAAAIMAAAHPTPLVGRVSPNKSLIVVVLPAPFGSRNPKMEFLATLKSSDLRACTPLQDLLKPCVSMTHPLDVLISCLSFQFLVHLPTEKPPYEGEYNPEHHSKDDGELYPSFHF